MPSQSYSPNLNLSDAFLTTSLNDGFNSIIELAKDNLIWL